MPLYIFDGLHMSYFDKNPVKVTVLSKINNTIHRTTYIIIGDVPSNVKREIKKHPKSSIMLKGIYGSKWRVKLGFDLIKQGGEDEEVEFKKEELGKDEDKDQFDVFDFDTLKISKIQADLGEVNWIFDVSIFPEDKISEFKQKLYMITHIPVYRQHLWHEIGNVTPLAYLLYKRDIKVNIDINTILTPSNVKIIEGIPIDMDMYENKSDIKIIAYDEFRILKDLHEALPSMEYYLVDLDNFIGPVKGKLEKMISPDKGKFELTLEMIYYSFVMKYFPLMTVPVFIEYIQREHSIGDYFPELAPSLDYLQKTLGRQDKIIRSKNEITSYLKNHHRGKDHKTQTIYSIQRNIKSSITIITINVIHNIIKKELIYLRNLFDQFDVDQLTNFVQTLLYHKGKRILLKKTCVNSVEQIERIQENTMLFRIFLNIETKDYMDLMLFSNGNYKVKTTWRSEDHYNFKDIFELSSQIINPIIDKINSYGAKVLRHGKIPLMTWDNVTFTDISVSIFYKCETLEQDFDILKAIFKELEEAKIVEQRSIERNSMAYYFLKGMYKFDPTRIEKIIGLNNYYVHYSDPIVKTKWDSIFIKCRILKIIKRFSGIKLEINGIKKPEYDIFLDYVLYILYQFTSKKKKITIKKHILRPIKKLASLKEQDPVLYDFKKKYGSDIIYSKICQKPFQPLLLTQSSYNRLSTKEKSNVLKWKNLTTLEDAYYYCPNPIFPYVRFKIGKHPKGYGIPCCQKTDVPKDPNDVSRIIHDKIMKDYIYLEERKAKVSSRYIMTYGKDIEVDRLSKLPEDTLGPLFYEETITDSDDCPRAIEYYLMGVPQHSLNINTVGYVFCLANALDKSLDELIIQTIEEISKYPQIFPILLQGRIIRYFMHLDDFIDELKTLFLGSELTITNQDLPRYEPNLWNILFIDIAKYYFMINTIIFEDFGDEHLLTLVIPPYINYPDDFIIDGYNNIIVIKKRKKYLQILTFDQMHYYPIYIINKEIYFKTQVVDQKLHANDSRIIDNIYQIVTSGIGQYDRPNCIDLNTIVKFVEFSQTVKMRRSRYAIELLYINKQNLCYNIKLSSNNLIYIPIKPSFYKLKGYPLSFEPYLRNKFPTQFPSLMLFVKDYNRWVTEYNQHNNSLAIVPYPSIDIQHWIELRSPKNLKPGKIIGFHSNDLSYYFSPINKNKALRHQKTTSLPLLYDLDNVNINIFNDVNPIVDIRHHEIGKALYKHYLYQLLILEFMDLFNRERNNTIRNKIYKILDEHGKNLSKALTQIYSIIINYYNNRNDNDQIDDCRKINQQIRLAVHQKQDLTHGIKSSRYNFDWVTINKLQNMNIKKVITELHKIAKKITSIESIDRAKDFSFPNIYISCVNFYKLKVNSGNIDYCRDKKLKITSTKLSEYLELLANDIIDPLKFKFMVNLTLIEKSVDYFKFIKRPNEIITISIG